MINIPINAEVNCLDGSCGESTVVIVNPVNRSITHVVVKAQWMPFDEYLVPIERVAETTPETISLTCTRAQLDEYHHQILPGNSTKEKNSTPVRTHIPGR